jgi:hypothetical protein
MAIRIHRNVLLGIFLAFLVLTGGYMIISITGFQEYIPVELTSQSLLADRPDWLTTEHVEKVTKILECYHEPYKIQDGKLLISSRLKSDRELTANYTYKARN